MKGSSIRKSRVGSIRLTGETEEGVMGQIIESIRSNGGVSISHSGNIDTQQFRPRKNYHVLHAKKKLGENLTERCIGKPMRLVRCNR